MLPLDESPNPKEDIGYWQGLVENARTDRQKLDELWSLCLDMYAGRYVNPRDITKDGEYVRTGLIKSTVDILFASTTQRRPKLLVHANTIDDVGAARMAQMLVNHWWRRLEIHPEFRRAWMDTLIFGNGWLKTAWHEDSDMVEAPDPPARDVEALSATASALSAATGRQLPESEYREAFAERLRGDPVERVAASHPRVERISPFDVWIDPYSDFLKDANWICHRIWKTQEEVHNDEEYVKSVREMVTPTSHQGMDIRSGRSRSNLFQSSVNDESSRSVAVYEFWDVERELFGVWAEGGEEYLVAPTDWPFPEQPFEMMTLYDIPDEPYAVGEVEPLITLEDEANATRTQMLDNRRHLVPKFLAAAKALDENNMAELASPLPGGLVEISGTYANPKEAIVPLAMPPIPHDLYRMFPIIRADIDRLASLDDIQRGSDGEIRKSATEAAIRHRVSQSRSGEKAEIVEETAARITRRMVSMAQQYLREPVLIRITGSDMGEEAAQFEAIGYEKLASGEEFDFSVEVGSMAIRDDTAAREEALALFKSLLPLAGQVVNPTKLVTNLLTAFGVKEPEQWLVQQQQQQPEAPQPDGAAAAAEAPAEISPEAPLATGDVQLPPALSGF